MRQITGYQCRAGRALRNVPVRKLAVWADVSVKTIVRLEAGKPVTAESARRIEAALVRIGVLFIDERGASMDGGPGVRLRLTAMPDEDPIA